MIIIISALTPLWGRGGVVHMRSSIIIIIPITINQAAV